MIGKLCDMLATRVYNIMRLRMTWQLVAERAVASTRLLAWMLCVICGGHYYLYEQRQRRHGGITRTVEGADARDGSCVGACARANAARLRCSCVRRPGPLRRDALRERRVGLASNHGPSKL